MAAHRPVSRLWLWLIGVVVAVVVGLVVADPYLPATVSFSTTDADAIQEYQRIVASHGYKYHVVVAANGEPTVVIDSISQRNQSHIQCELERWRAVTHRNAGVTNVSAKDCAL